MRKVGVLKGCVGGGGGEGVRTDSGDRAIAAAHNFFHSHWLWSPTFPPLSGPSAQPLRKGCWGEKGEGGRDEGTR